jgi:hypothetical protein
MEPKGVKMESPPCHNFVVCVEQMGAMVGAQGQQVKLVPRVDGFPCIGEENTVDALEGGVLVLIAPSKQPPLK